MIKSFIDPLDLPEHEPERFNKFYDIDVDGRKGFKLDTGETFFLNDEGCWKDEEGCVYSAEGQAEGWLIKCSDGLEHYYDLDGRYLPSDIEMDKEEKKLPKHSNQVNVYEDYAKIGDKKIEFDEDGGLSFEDSNGCYYDENGKPAGWMLAKADGERYLFDMEGYYIEREQADNDLGEFDLGTIVQKPARKEKVKRQIFKHVEESKVKDNQRKQEVKVQEPQKQPQKQPQITQEKQQPQPQLQPHYKQQQNQQQYSNNQRNQNRQPQKLSYKFKLQNTDDVKILMTFLKDIANQKLNFQLAGQVLSVTSEHGSSIQQFEALNKNLQFAEGKFATLEY